MRETLWVEGAVGAALYPMAAATITLSGLAVLLLSAAWVLAELLKKKG